MNSGSILCRPPLPELDTCACLWYAQHTCPFGRFWTQVHALSRLVDVWPGRVEPIGSKLQSLSNFAEPEGHGWVPGRVEHSEWSVSSIGFLELAALPQYKK